MKHWFNIITIVSIENDFQQFKRSEAKVAIMKNFEYEVFQ